MNRHLILPLVVCVMLTICLVPMVSDDSSAEKGVTVGDISVHTFTDSLSINAGKDDTVTVVLTNKSAADTYHITLSSDIDAPSRISTGVEDAPKSLDAGKSATAKLTVSAATTASSGNYTLTLKITVRNVATDGDPITEELSFPVKISSNYSSEGYYNKIMGSFQSPFDNPYITAGISLAIWIAIAFALNVILTFLLTVRAEAYENPGLRKDAKGAGFFVMILTLLFGIPQCIRISGMDETVIATVSDFVTVVIALNIAYIIWKIYKILAYHVIVKRDKNDRIDDSLYPLFKMLGKIVITVLTLSYILSVYGLDLGTIITSAGIATLAISLGAQSTLNQFFCGLVLLVTRPFRIGDKVRLGNSSEVLIVRKIGVMETEFKVWLNEEVQHIPNSTVMASSIANITKGDKCYKVVDYIDIDYNADIDKARDIIMGILTAHPRIVNDGSKSRPDFRVNSLEDSSIRIRISYIVYDHEIWHAVSCQVKEAIYKKFMAEGIKVPHNIIDVHTE